MKVVFGVGNPGKEYALTRHNLGFVVADELARRHGGSWERMGASLVAEVRMGRQDMLLAKPQTYVNSCGLAAREIVERGVGGVEELLVVVDEASLELGKLRFRRSGSSGGHRGLRSLVEELGTEEFYRLRIGIGRPREADLIDHVLGEFGEEEWEAVRDVTSAASDAAAVWAEFGIDECMNRYN